jgi:hypothetical protein
MKIFLSILSILVIIGCSHSTRNSEVNDVKESSENLILFLKDNDSFEIYYKSDTMSFYLESGREQQNEYTYDIYSLKDEIKRGRFIYGVNFEDSDTIELYFKCSSISLPKVICNKWILFVKDSQSELYYKKLD